MIFIKNVKTGKYVQYITLECVGWTDYRLDAFDLDYIPNEAGQKEYREWINASEPETQVEFVEE